MNVSRTDLALLLPGLAGAAAAAPPALLVSKGYEFADLPVRTSANGGNFETCPFSVSVIFSSFNDLNGWKNVGTTPVQYYVVSLEERSA